MSWTSPSRRGTTIGSGSSSSAFNRSICCASRVGELLLVGGGLRDLRGEGVVEAGFAQLGVARRRVDVVGDVHAVDDEAAERHAGLAQLAAEEDRLGDRLALGRRHDEERRRVVGEQRLDARRALLEAVHEAAQRAEEDRDVVHEVDARQPLEDREHDARAARHDPRRDPRRDEQDLQRAALEEVRQAVGRVEEVQRVARRRRVEHEHVEAAVVVQVVELRDGGELLRPGDRVRELLVDAVAEDVVARLRVGRQPRDEIVERRLRVEHHRPQLAFAARTPCEASSAGSTCRGSLPSSSRPSDSARRFAGSIVTTATRLPVAASPSASAADAVVLPTPPEPATMQTRHAVEALGDAGHAGSPAATRSSCGASSSARRSRSGPPGCSSRRAGSCSQSSARRASCARWRSARSWPRSARATAGCSATRAQPRGLVVVEAIGVQRVGDDALDRQAHALAQRRAQLARLGDGELLGARDGDDRGLRRDPTASRRSSCPGARPARVPAAAANVRGAVSTATPWPVAGASTTTRSYGSAPGVRRSSCASSQSLPTVSSSRMPGVAAASSPKTRLRARMSASGPRGSWSRRYSSSASCGSIEM